MKQARVVGDAILKEIVKVSFSPKNKYPQKYLDNKKTEEKIEFLLLTPKDALLINLPRMPIFKSLMRAFMEHSVTLGRDSNEVLLIWEIMAALTVMVTKSKSFAAVPGAFLIAENILRGGDQDTIDFLSNIGITPAYSTYKRQKSDLLDSRDLPDNWLLHPDVNIKTLPQQRKTF